MEAVPLTGWDAQAPAVTPPTQTNRPLQTFEDIADAFAWTGYPNMMTLITLTHRRLRGFKGSFDDFCIKHKAMTMDRKICTFKYIDKKGNKSDAVFAYPFFVAIKKLIESRDAKRNIAETLDIMTAEEAGIVIPF